MRVLFIAVRLDLTEAHLVAGLARSGCEALAIVGPERRYADVLEAAGVRVETRDWSRSLLRRDRRALRQRIDAWRPRIVHAFDNTAVYDLGRARPAAGAAWIADRGAAFLSTATGRFYRRVGIARIVCLSETVRAALLHSGWPPERLAVIHKGHDPSWYAPATAARLRALGIPDGVRLVGAAARWRPLKRGPVLVDAFRRLPTDHRWRLLMIGEVADRRLARRRRAADPRILFPGYQPDAAALLGACDITVLPSGAREGLGKVVIESLAQGVPTVVGDRGGPAEIVRDGVEGLCVPEGDPAALAAALARLMGDEPFRRACAARARERILGEFHVARTVARYRALYEELAGAAAPAG